MTEPDESSVRSTGKQSDAVLDRLLRRIPRDRDLSFGEAYELLGEFDFAIDGSRDRPEVSRELDSLRQKILDRLDARAAELGETEKWEALKQRRATLRTIDDLCVTKDGLEFFDTFRGVPSDQRTALDKEGVPIRELGRHESLAGALRQDSVPRILVALIRTNPVAAIKLIGKHFWGSAVIILCGLAFLWISYRTIAAVLIAVGIVHALRVAAK